VIEDDIMLSFTPYPEDVEKLIVEHENQYSR